MKREKQGETKQIQCSKPTQFSSALSSVGDDLLSTHALELMFDFPVSACVCLFEWGVILPPPAGCCFCEMIRGACARYATWKLCICACFVADTWVTCPLYVIDAVGTLWFVRAFISGPWW